MYESNENKIEWGPILKKAGIFAGILVITVIIILLVGKCTKKDNNKPVTDETPVTLSKQLDSFEEALLKYLNKDNLPKEINSSKTVRLKLLEDKDLITKLVDNEENTCDSNESFAEITKFENNYAVNISLNCGSNRENRLIYVGCFSECNGGVCKGTAESEAGICGEVATDDDNSSTSSGNNTDTKPETNKPSNNTTNTKPNTSTTKPNNNQSSSKPNNTTKPTTPSKPSDSNSSSNNNNNNTGNNNNKVEPLYEYKKCSINYSCKEVGGTLNSDNKCVINEKYSDYATLLSRTVRSQKPNLHEYNQSNRNFIYIGYRNGSYEYTEYYCENQGYSVDLNKKRCYGYIYKDVLKPAKETESCRYTWSYSTNLDGWVKTGRTQ